MPGCRISPGVMWALEGLGGGVRCSGAGLPGDGSSAWWLDGRAEERPHALRVSVGRD